MNVVVEWTKEQEAAIDTAGTNLLVAAAAGSGKTAVLVERIIQKLIDQDAPINIDEILVATFTNAAAEEMRNRVGIGLEKAIAEDPTSYQLKKQLSLLQRASISTLHAFCTQVVRQYAYLLDLDPGFRIGDEMEIDLIKQEVIGEMFEEAYSEDNEDAEKFFHVVNMFSNDRSDVEVENLILQLYTFATQNPWPEQWLRDVAIDYAIAEDVDEASLPWLRMLKTEVQEQLYAFREEISRALQLTEAPDGPYHYAEALEVDLQFINMALHHEDDWDKLQEIFTTSKLKSLSSKRVECDESLKEKIKQIRQAFRDAWNKMKADLFSRKLADHLEDMRKLYPAMQELTNVVIEFKKRFSAVKREKALVDFSDLEHFCLEILIDASSTEENIIPSEVALAYKSEFKEVLVDEYQDINLVQETILSVISDQEGPGNMFMVGDVKQSIYRFRHAEPTLFIDKYKRYVEDETAGKRIDLAKNFRSREAVLTGANYVFRQIFDEAVGEIDYDDRAELIYGNLSYEETPFEHPEVELLVIDREAGAERERETAGEDVDDLETVQLEARLYAQQINEWIGNTDKPAMQVVDKATNKQRDIQFKDIVILQRSLTGLATMMSELKKQGIPVYAEMRTGYFAAIEIQVMINMLKVIDNPYQDIPLASVLRSPIVGLDEEQLTRIRLLKRNEPFYEGVKAFAVSEEDGNDVVHHFLEQLKAFRLLAKEGALSALIWEIFNETGYYDFVGGIPGGRQRQANLRALYDRARGYESTSFRGLFRFLRFIERMEEQGKDLGEARALSEQEDVVRIMTIHKSKGLEFPAVIVGGMNKEFNYMDTRRKYILDKDLGFATKYIDVEKRITYPTLFYLALQQEALRKLLAEEMRVLYVAMTRAKEKIVMIGNVREYEKELEKWQQVIHHPTWVLPKQVRKKAKSYLDLVGPSLVRHQDNKVLQGDLLLSNDVPRDVVEDKSKWKISIIDGSTLTNMDERKKIEKAALRQSITSWTAFERPDAEASLSQKVADVLDYEYAHQEATEAQAKQSVTEIKRRQELADVYSGQDFVQAFRAPIVARPKFMQTEKKLAATEIGTAMHTVMQHLPLTHLLTAAEIKAHIEGFVEKEIMTEEEAKEINLLAIERFFQSEIGSLMMESNQVEREIPFTYMLQASEVYLDWKGAQEEKVLIQGVIDCILITGDKTIILDYKTDKIMDDALSEETVSMLKERYKVQVKLYEQALGDILQRPIDATYLYFFDKDILIKA